MNNPLKIVFAELQAAELTPLSSGYDTGWRTLPCEMCCHYRRLDGRASDEPAGRLERPDEPDLLIPCGEGLLVPAGARHRIVTVGEELASAWAHFTCTTGWGAELSEIYRFPLRLGAEEDMPTIGKHLDTLIALFRDRKPDHDLRTSLECAALAALLLHHAELKAPVCAPDAQRVEPAIRELCRHPEKIVPVARLAARCGLSESRFRALFHTVTGLAPREFKERERIRSACRMLWDGGIPLGEIAERLGYCDIFHFSRAFRRATGIPPGQYRKNFRAE